MATRKPKSSIDDYKDRMTAPFKIVVTTKKQKNKKKKGN